MLQSINRFMRALSIFLLVTTMSSLLAATLFFSGCTNSKELDMDKILSSPNYKDGKFVNREPITNEITSSAPFKIWYDIFIAGDRPKEIAVIKNDLRSNIDRDFFIWFGHSSYMLQVEGKKILIDPVFDSSASPIPFVNRAFSGTDKYSTKDLPYIDYLVITHNHYDHLSKSSIKELKDRVEIAIVPLGVGKYLRDWGFIEDRIIELDWDEEYDLGGGFKIFCLSARHYSKRGINDRDTTLWASFLLESKSSRRLYFGGDSGYGAHFKDIGKKFGKIDLAFLENGQYDKDWSQIHMFPEEVLKASVELNSEYLMPDRKSVV